VGVIRSLQRKTHLFESLVVYETGSIFGNLELTLLDLFPELPGGRY
jgi:hypothetical protein